MKNINSIVRAELRRSLCNRFDGKCAYCRRYVGMAGTVDHYLPQALGGTNARKNLRWCCVGCNQAKADMHPSEWEERRPVPVCEPSKAERRAALVALSVAQRGAVP